MEPQTSSESSAGDEPKGPPVDPWAGLLSHLGELIEYLSCYLGIELERRKLSLKDALWKMAVMGGLLCVAIGALLIAIAFVLYGISQGVGEIWGGRPWLGYMIVGLSVLFIVMMLLIWRQMRSTRKI